jgi:hypothetical protein
METEDIITITVLSQQPPQKAAGLQLRKMVEEHIIIKMELLQQPNLNQTEPQIASQLFKFLMVREIIITKMVKLQQPGQKAAGHQSLQEEQDIIIMMMALNQPLTLTQKAAAITHTTVFLTEELTIITNQMM